MVMLELLKKGTPDNQPVIDINAVIALLCDETRIIDWDDADDALNLLDPSYREDLSTLIATALDQEFSTEARLFAIEAATKIDPDLREVVKFLVKLLKDKENLVRHTVAIALRDCASEDYSLVVPALAEAAKDWHSYLGTQITAFSTLVVLLGSRRAVESLLSLK